VLEEMQESNNVCISKPHGTLRQFWDFLGNGTIRSKLGKYLSVINGELQCTIIKALMEDTWSTEFCIIPVSW
jgi:hypothetical protein